MSYVLGDIMGEVFFEIVLPPSDGQGQPVEWRQSLEDELQDLLTTDGVGEVSGGGTSATTMHIDVDGSSETDLQRALMILRRALVARGISRDARIHRHRSRHESFFVREKVTGSVVAEDS